MRRIDFIVNPISGTHGKGELPALVAKMFPYPRFDVRIHITTRAGQGFQIAKEAIDRNSDTIVAVGGDGTVNEIASALAGCTRVKLGIIPMGSGNGLALHAEIPLVMEEALEVIKNGHSELIDYGDVNGHLFFTTAGTGFDADVGEHFSKMGMRGPITYGRAIVEKAFHYQPRTYTIYTDHKVIKQEAFMITVGNAAQWGNHFYVAPGASQQDGLFNVTIVKPFLVLLNAPVMAIQLISRQFDQNRHVETFETRHLRIESEELGYFHVDGEPIKLESPVEITMHAASLRILVPLNRQGRL
ncbi:MAG: diacylglycerol kinase family lipid kinase [Bacteroidales bacterium]|nr:diacylglycerol kinase family lipid kinase [Bacteroidales bacterium]